MNSLENKVTVARARINKLLDNGSFMEIGAEIVARSTDFNEAENKEPTDGVITGYGTLNGKLVYVFAQDPEVLAGTIGEMHAKKIKRVYEMALKTKAPVIGMLASAGIRIKEGLDGFNAFGEIYRIQAKASKKIPQIMGVFGTCGGGMAFMAALADFLYLEKDKGKLFVHAESTIDRTVAGLDKTLLGGISEEITDGVMPEEQIISSIRSLIDLIPQNVNEHPWQIKVTDDLNRINTGIRKMRGNARALIRELSDDNCFFEVRSTGISEMVTGFMRLNGKLVGAVANNGGKLTAKCFLKSTSFVKYCNKYSIPLLTLTDVDGFETTLLEEQYLASSVTQWIKTLALSDMPKVNVIVGAAYGSAYNLMNSQALGADFVFAWEDAQVNLMHTETAMKILYAEEIEDSVSRDLWIKENRAKYEELYCGANALARRGYIDRIIEPENTRKYIIGAFETLELA